jgi:hypothetical protein
MTEGGDMASELEKAQALIMVDLSRKGLISAIKDAHRKWKEVDEQRGEVTLHMEAEVLGKIVPGSLKISPWEG